MKKSELFQDMEAGKISANELEKKIAIYDTAEEEDIFLFQNSKLEFLFFLDRSGSMCGERIEIAKRTLILFLQSLPRNSKFNVISFGSHYEKMFPSSVGTDQVHQIYKKIKKMKADLGGTSLNKPVIDLLSTPPNENRPRNIFLLTDGAILNVTEFIETVTYFSKVSNDRFFSIGIGNGCSSNLVH